MLETTWFLLVGVLLIGYALLDGFDLGVGMLHLFVARGDVERRLTINAVGPVWDGNEVWLLTAGGALFAAFPRVYATVFSGLYLALVLVLTALLLRAVCLEWRGKEPGAAWRGGWDRVFAFASFVPALLFGVALGNVARGLPLDRDLEFAGTFAGLLNPFALAVGLLAVAAFLVHGAAWLALKTEGPVRARALRAAPRLWWAFAALWALATILSRLEAPHLWTAYRQPVAWLVPAAFVAAALACRQALVAGRAGRAFLASSLAIAALLGIVGQGLYPNLVPALGAPGSGLTLANSASSPLALRAMLVVALAGMPIVIGYTIFIYTRFRGPVRLDDHSY